MNMLNCKNYNFFFVADMMAIIIIILDLCLLISK